MQGQEGPSSGGDGENTPLPPPRLILWPQAGSIHPHPQLSFLFLSAIPLGFWNLHSRSSAVRAWSPNFWTIREVQGQFLIIDLILVRLHRQIIRNKSDSIIYHLFYDAILVGPLSKSHGIRSVRRRREERFKELTWAGYCPAGICSLNQTLIPSQENQQWWGLY